MLAKFLALLGIGLLMWLLYHTVRTNPDTFSKESLSRSFMTMGFLALLLIAVVGFVVIILRASH